MRSRSAFTSHAAPSKAHVGHSFVTLDVPAGPSQNRRVQAVRRYLDVQHREQPDRA